MSTGNGNLPASPPLDEPRVNILLVDDQPANLLSLEAVLDGLGQNLVKARSGREALRELLERDFAVVLMDVQMPGMDGMETAALIRQRDRCKHTPIIFLTAYESGEHDVFKGYQLGAVDFLYKPIVPQVLRAKVAVFVELFRKTEQVKRQAQLLWQTQEREHARQLAEEKQRWEMERLREEAAREKKIAQELAEADRRKDEFLAMLAHELRNPLAPLRNALEVLRLQQGEPAAVGQARDMAERQVRHLTRLVDDLLDVSRITHGKIKLQKEPVEFRRVMERAVESTRPLIEERRHRLEVSSPTEPLWLEADPTRLEQILANLLNNAAKYTPEGGHIWLEALHENGDVVARVRDTGVGIAPEMRDRIFELFTQAERSVASPSQWGLGIGLALVRRLVEMHGGAIKCRSPGQGQGSEFVVRLPLLRGGPCPKSAPPPAACTARGPGLRVLVVDDNADAAESLAMLLRLKGHDTRLAHDGPAALRAVRDWLPDVAVLDIGLPGMSGYDLARALRQEANLDRALLVALTGYGHDEDRRRSAAAGFDHHLVKPVEPEALQALLAEAAGRLAGSAG